MLTKREIMKKYTDLLSEYKIRLIIAMILLVVSTILIIYIPKIAGQTINLFLDDEVLTNKSQVITNLIELILLTVIGYLLKLPSNRIMIFIGEKITYNLRMELHNKLITEKLELIDFEHSGNIMARINNDLMNVRNLITTHLANYLSYLLTAILSLILLINTHLELSLIYIVSLPFYLILIYYIDKKSKKSYKKHQKEMGVMMGNMGDSFRNQLAIKAFNSEEYIEKKFEKINKQTTDYFFMSRSATSLNPPFTLLVINLCTISVYIFSVYLLIHNQIEIGTLLTVILYGQIFFKQVKSLSNSLNSLETSLASMDRIYEVLDSKSYTSDPYDVPKENIKGEIEFKNVNYNQTLKDFNFKVDAGDLVSITGSPSSGKSTLMELLIGLMKIDSGEILLDGTNIYDMDVYEYRGLFGYVPQEKWIFDGTIAENIGYGIDDYTEDDIKNVCKLLGIDNIIESLPDKYNTKISDDKNTISDSEKDLITLARAMIRNPKICIIDDYEEDVTNILKNRTTFFITNNENIIQKSDKVINMDLIKK